jgi:hypothetical protein
MDSQIYKLLLEKKLLLVKNIVKDLGVNGRIILNGT